METSDRRALLPQAERLLSHSEVQSYFPRLSRPLAAKAVSRALDGLRSSLESDPGRVLEEGDALRAALRELDELDRRRLRRTLNGTGVVLHTNLGRSPVDARAWAEAGEANTGYTNLEYDLAEGKRGRRGGLVPDLLCELSGAPAAVVVNNNAAAVLLALSEIARGREVLVSRGEAVQIGGGFRVPDILAMSGAKLREVGTTNVTTAGDYFSAVGPDTAAVLSVHAANFALRGFVRRPDLRELAAGLPAGVPLIVDQGSGCTTERVPGEQPVRRYLKAGAGLVCFSCDKIAGGPQAGAIVGDAELVARIARNPLMRAFRPGKTVLSLLERALVARLGTGSGEEALSSPGSSVTRALLRSSKAGIDDLKALARKIARRLPKEAVEVAESRAALGGGSSPDETVPSYAIFVAPPRGADSLLAALRAGRTPLVARAEDGRVVVDVLTLADEDDALVSALIAEALEREGAAASAP